MLWIRIRIQIRMDPHPSDKLDPGLDPDPQQFADDNPQCVEFETI
jgi:hypothetical protein